MPAVPKRAWSQILFACSYISCLLSPVVIGIEQKVISDSALFILLSVCDLVCLRELYNVVKRAYFSDESRSRRQDESAAINQNETQVYEIILRFASCSCLVILPLGNMLGLGGAGLAWFSVLRLVCELCHCARTQVAASLWTSASTFCTLY